jgi:hypothetical protein
MHIQESQISQKKNKKINSRIVVRCTGACLDHNNVSILATYHLWTSEPPFGLAPLEFLTSAPRDLPAYVKDDHH